MAPPAKKYSNNKSDKAFKKPHKPSFKRSDDAVSKPAPLPLDDDVPDFPRGSFFSSTLTIYADTCVYVCVIVCVCLNCGVVGGGRTLTREERNGIREQVDEDFDSEVSDFKKRKNKAQSRSSFAEDDNLGSLFAEGITGKLPRFANRITLKVSLFSINLNLL